MMLCTIANNIKDINRLLLLLLTVYSSYLTRKHYLFYISWKVIYQVLLFPFKIVHPSLRVKRVKLTLPPSHSCYTPPRVSCDRLLSVVVEACQQHVIKRWKWSVKWERATVYSRGNRFNDLKCLKESLLLCIVGSFWLLSLTLMMSNWVINTLLRY